MGGFADYANALFLHSHAGNPRGTESEAAYSMKAVSFDKNREARVLIHAHDGTSLVCESSKTTCDETPFF